MDIYPPHPTNAYPNFPISMTPCEAETYWEAARREMRSALAKLPPSSFARTMLEEDDLFYATFPLAKQAAIEEWILQHMPQPATGASIASSPHGCHSTPAQHYVTEDVHLTNHLKVESPNSSFLALNYDYEQPNTPEVATKGHSSRFQDAYFPVEPSSSLPSPPASPQIIHLASHLIVPSQKREDVLVPNNFARLASSSKYRDPAAKLDGTEATPPPVAMVPSPPLLSLSTYKPPQFTGDWAADAMAAETHLHAPRPSYADKTLPALIPWDVPVVEVPSTRRHHLTYRQHRDKRSRSRSQPYLSTSETRSESPPMSHAGASRPRKRVKPGRDKDGKPIMACLFCRGRKIACGPPSADSHDKTCNQCARRNLECTYPLENRRGMRKPRLKKDVVVKLGVAKYAANVKHSFAVKVKAEEPEPEDVAMSDEESGSEWDGDT